MCAIEINEIKQRLAFLDGLVDVPIASITSLTSEEAVKVIRSTLRAECRYACLNPTALTMSGRLTVADGGIDAEVNAATGTIVPIDCLFKVGLTGFQIKSGSSFKPWTPSAIRSELLDSKGVLFSEVKRLVERGGHYTLICTGHDLTSEQRNNAIGQIAKVLAGVGFPDYEPQIDVIGASQLGEFIERYPGVASRVSKDPIQEALVFDEWVRDSQMSNRFEPSENHSDLIDQIRQALMGKAKHIRVLGEPGLGKTRLVLEALRDVNLLPFVLYIEHGSVFGQTKLFRQLLKTERSKPLILVIDELPEPEMAEIWRHLKMRCGTLKIVSLDHNRDETQDFEIVRLVVPPLSNETLKKILVNTLGDLRELDRWVDICEGSPRVAQAVADNLRANPDDLLRSPATVPIWDRFLHGYGKRDDQQARQIDCVTQHLALFNRFGFEDPVGSEARYIAALVSEVDPSLGWARFQEITQKLRARRVLQGSRTLFFVPKALHIYLWKRFWQTYGRGFDFTKTFTDMPETLHTWFMNMFKYAGDGVIAPVIEQILNPSGIYSDRVALTTSNGAHFLSTLAEANPESVLRLLEATLGKWSDDELASFKDNRQIIVWTVEKLAVWPKLVARAIRLLLRLAANETDNFSNNATGTVLGLFRIGPEAAATEAAPAMRLAALLPFLRSSESKERELGLKCIEAALETQGHGFRVVGPEYQGLKPRAELWIPKTYEEWRQAHYLYFKTLIDETKSWPDDLRPMVCSALLSAIQNQIKIEDCTAIAFEVLTTLVQDPKADPGELNKFFDDWPEYRHEPNFEEITRRIVAIGRTYTKQSLANRFRRYVINVDWRIWDEDARERRGKCPNRAKPLVNALAKRVSQNPGHFESILPLCSSKSESPALWHFGEQLAANDPARQLQRSLIVQTLSSKHWGCVGGYLFHVRKQDAIAFRSTVCDLLSNADAAWLGAELALRSDYDQMLFLECLLAYENKRIDANQFYFLRYGQFWKSIPLVEMGRLVQLLSDASDEQAAGVLVGLLSVLPFDASSPFTATTVLSAILRSIPNEHGWVHSSSYEWQDVCEKLIEFDSAQRGSLLDALLKSMADDYKLSYDPYIGSVSGLLVKADPDDAWRVIRRHFETALPKWRVDLFQWLKGGLGGFDESDANPPINLLPRDAILDWVSVDPFERAGLIAHCVPGTLDFRNGGNLTCALIEKYPELEGVVNGCEETLFSGCKQRFCFS